MFNFFAILLACLGALHWFQCNGTREYYLGMTDAVGMINVNERGKNASLCGLLTHACDYYSSTCYKCYDRELNRPEFAFMGPQSMCILNCNFSPEKDKWY